MSNKRVIQETDVTESHSILARREDNHAMNSVAVQEPMVSNKVRRYVSTIDTLETLQFYVLLAGFIVGGVMWLLGQESLEIPVWIAKSSIIVGLLFSFALASVFALQPLIRPHFTRWREKVMRSDA